MPVTETGGSGDRRLDRVDELGRPLDRLPVPAACDRPRDLPGEALLAVPAEDLLQLALAGLVDELAGGVLGRRVHPHVERRVGRVREAALGPVELHRGHPEVEEDRVGADAVLRELPQDDAEVAAQEPSVHGYALRELLEVRAGRRVAVDRDQLPLAAQVGGEDGGMPAGAEGGVDDRLAGLHGKRRPHLLGKDGDVVSFPGLQDVRQHPQHSLRPRRARAARRRGPRSRGGR